MEEKELVGFTFFKSYYECLCDLPIENKNEILNAMLEYVFDNVEPELTGLSKTIWVLIKPNLTTSKNRSHRNAGAPKGNQNASKQSKNNQKTIKKQSLTSLDKDKDKDKDNNIGNNINIENNNIKENNNNVCVNNNEGPTHTDIFNFSLSAYPGYNEADLKRSTKKFYNFYNEKKWQGVSNWKNKIEMWIDQDISDKKIKEKKKNENSVDEAGFLHRDGKRVFE